MTHVVSLSNFTTGMMDMDQHSFTWTIENFPLIRNSQSMIEAQKIYFTAGTRLGRPSKWSVRLGETDESVTEDGKKWIGIYFTIEDPPASDPIWKNVFAEMSFTLERRRRVIKDTGLKPVAELTSGGYGFQQFVSPASTKEKLVIKHTFKLYVHSKSTEACQPILKDFQAMFTTQAKKDWGLLLKNGSGDDSTGNCIKVISKDKKEFSVQKGILAVRSPVLEAMVRTDMLEANSGVIELPDISSTTLQILLNFLYTGELLPNWTEREVIVELTNAAAKYQLQDLLKFLDATLGTVCKMENVLALFTLAHQLSLKTAEKELSKYIHAHSTSSELICKMLEGVPVPDMDLSSKGKSCWKVLGMWVIFVFPEIIIPFLPF